MPTGWRRYARDLRELRQHGIRLLGSTIVGMEHHTPENIGKRLSVRSRMTPTSTSSCVHAGARHTAVSADAARRAAVGGQLADIHGQIEFNFRHPAISRDESKVFLDGAFRRDFERNGPSLFRVCRTTLQGWKRYKTSGPRIRRRFCHEAKALKWSYSGLLWAMERMLRPTNESVAGQIRELRDEFRREFGLATMLSEWLLGPLMLATAKGEERRLANGITYEPKAMIERTNWVGDTDSAVLPESIRSVFRPDYALSNIVARN